MKVKTTTIVRVALLILALANLACGALGIVPEEVVADSDIYRIGSVLVTIVLSLINMWENNSFTTEAIKADEFLESLLAAKKDTTETDNAES